MNTTVPSLDKGESHAESLAIKITEANLATLVYRFYEKIRINPEIGPVFHAAIHDWDSHLRTMVQFWTTIMLASRTYKGNPLAAHAQIPITASMFTRWLVLWDETTNELFTPACAALLQQKAHKMGQNMQFALGLLQPPVSRERQPGS